jgi:arsenical pump membrane protein
VPPPLSDVVVVLALVGMLIVAFGHPRGRVEVAMGVACAGATVATGILTLDEARAAVDHLAPVVAFLVTILVVSDVCARSGVFDAAARRVSRWSGPSAVRLFTGVFVLAAVVTATLSLDATVVLLTPVVLAAAMARAVPGTPATYACLRMANSASLLLPVSNLTNLLALPHLDLTFTGFAARMAPVLAVVLVVEYVGLRLIFREALAATPATADAPLRPVPRFPVAVVALMLLGFALVSPFGGDPWWASLVAAAALAAYAVRRGLARPIHLVHAAHPGFAFWVLALGVVVAGLGDGFLGPGLDRPRCPARRRGARDRARQPPHQPLRDPAAGPRRGPARHIGGAGRPARAQHRLRPHLDRLAGEPAVAADAGPARRAPDQRGVPPGLAHPDPRLTPGRRRRVVGGHLIRCGRMPG